MKRETLCALLSDVDATYIVQAHAPCKAKKAMHRRRHAMAAGLTAALLVAGAVAIGGLRTADGALVDTPNGQMASVCMREVYFNPIAAPVYAARRWYDPAQYDFVSWDAQAIAAYFGTDLTPAYVPPGLTASPANGTAQVVLDKDGAVVEDTVWLGFFHDFYEDGSPMLTQDVNACKGLTITASKRGLLGDCVYLLPEDETRTSKICGTAVQFGYRSMPHGPYDPQTHAPAGHYDLYVAEFERAGIQYQIVATQLQAEEIVKVAASLITGQSEIFVALE